MESNGYVLLHRKIIEWEWWDDLKISRLFETLIMLANHKAADWHGITIERGQLVTSLDSLAEKSHLTRQSVRTALNKLKSTQEITQKTTHRFSIITINKYNEFQAPWEVELTQKSTQTSTFNQHAINTLSTLNNNDNNENKIIYPPVAPAKKTIRRENGKHRFEDSPFYDPNEFRANLDWPPDVCDYWFDVLLNASAANSSLRYNDWLCVARQWKLREERGKR